LRKKHRDVLADIEDGAHFRQKINELNRLIRGISMQRAFEMNDNGSLRDAFETLKESIVCTGPLVSSYNDTDGSHQDHKLKLLPPNSITK
jgi:hypothetical protein